MELESGNICKVEAGANVNVLIRKISKQVDEGISSSIYACIYTYIIDMWHLIVSVVGMKTATCHTQLYTYTVFLVQGCHTSSSASVVTTKYPKPNQTRNHHLLDWDILDTASGGLKD